MPSIEAIDRIKNVVNSFGNEEAILQQRGASIEDVLPPEGGVDDELQDLMAPTVDSDDLGTVDSLLSSLDEETGDSGFDLSGPEEEIFSDEPEEDEEESIDLGGLDDLEDLGGLDDLEDFSVQEEPDEDLADDLDGMDDLGGLDDLDGVEDLAGLNDDDLNTLDDLDEIDDGDIAGLGEMEDLEDLGGLDDLEDLGGEDFSDEDDIPDTEAALENLAQSLEEDEPFGGGENDGGEEIVLDEDFGLSEIDDDFLDDLNDDEGNQFSLDDLGSEYNFTEDDTDASGDLGFDLDELENDINQTVASEAALNFEISHGDLEKLEAALYGLPLNLKIAVQDFLSDDASTVDQLEKMIDLVTRDVPPRQIAQLYKNFTGKQVDIPRGYEKKSGDDFARERNSLRTFASETVVPRIVKGVVYFLAFWVVAIILFQFAYRPLKAESLYKQGAELIEKDEYKAGEDRFNNAFFGWDLGPFQVRGVRREDKFFLYADAYKSRRKYDLAETKYQQLLQAYPENEDARCAYGELLSRDMIRYRDAEYVLKGAAPLKLAAAIAGEITYESIPLQEITEINDIDRLILLGDNYLAWADTDPEKFENARYIYATLLKDKRGGGTDEVLLRMFRYLIRTDNKEEIESLRLMYKDKERVSASPTLQAEVFAELAGWLIDNDRILESRDFILKAEEADRTVPDAHYQHARFFEATYNLEGEKNTLTNALGFLGQMTELDKAHIFMQIDAYRRLGNISLTTGDYAKAEDQYLMALEIYENSHRLNLIGTSPEIGALYTELGNLKYDWSADYDAAMDYFELAEDNQGGSPEINYKKGFIRYEVQDDYSSALMDFYQVSRAYPENRNLLLAMGNTLTERGDFYGAVSHYEQLLSQLLEQKNNIKVLLPDEKDEEWALMEYLIMTYNNLGIAQNGIARKTPNRTMDRKALTSFSQSSEYFDLLLRNRDTLGRTELTDRAGENRQTLLDDTAEDKELKLYEEILPHLQDLPLFYKKSPAN